MGRLVVIYNLTLDSVDEGHGMVGENFHAEQTSSSIIGRGDVYW